MSQSSPKEEISREGSGQSRAGLAWAIVTRGRLLLGLGPIGEGASLYARAQTHVDGPAMPKLGAILVYTCRALTEEQLEQALEGQREEPEKGRRLGEILLAMGLISVCPHSSDTMDGRRDVPLPADADRIRQETRGSHEKHMSRQRGSASMGAETLRVVVGVLWLLGAMVVSALGTEGEGGPQNLAPAWVAKVNGEPISAQLFQRRLIRNRSRAYRHFRQQYGAEESADFWTTSHEGTTPLGWLKQVTLEECVRIKVEQIVAREQGVVSDITYSAFLEALEQENERRQRALGTGEPIYGPKQYREDEYFTYVFTNMVIHSKRRLWETKLHASEETLRSYYESVKDRLYQRGDRVRIQAIMIPFGRDNPDAPSRAEAEEKMDEALRKLEEGARLEDLARECSGNGDLYERVLDEESARFDERMRPILRGEAMKLAVGETSPVFEEHRALYIIRCVERESLGHMPFDEVKHNVRNRYVDEEYEELVDDLVGEAEVEVNELVYEALRVR